VGSCRKLAREGLNLLGKASGNWREDQWKAKSFGQRGWKTEEAID